MLRYRRIERLAVGGMAELSLCCQIGGDDAGRLVVEKRVLEELADAEEFVELFAHEAALASRLDHPNVVRVLWAGTDRGVPVLVMEHLDGLDVRALLARARGPLPAVVACAIAAGAARGLGHAHQLCDEAGTPLAVVHRDVSPHNVFVTRDGEVKVLDFGIAKARSRLVETRSGLGRGKVAYFAPEQLVGAPLDARSDLFALGTVLWEMLVGRTLWDRGQDDLTARAIRQDPAPPPGEALARARAVHPAKPMGPMEQMSCPVEVPAPAWAALDALVLRLLSKFPATRPARAIDVAMELERIAAELVGGACVAPMVAALVARCAPPATGAGVSG